MQAVYRLGLLAGMLFGFVALACAQDAGSTSLKTTNMPTRREAGEQKLHRAENSHDDRDALRRRAEADLEQGAILLQKQTSKDLNTAILLFRESVRFFKAAHFYSRAADADLQLGESYFLLSLYHNALSAYREALNTGNLELRCRALSHIARTYATMGQSSRAGSYSQQALDLSEGLSGRTRAEALEARGEAVQDVDQARGSELFTQAQAAFAEAGDKNGQAEALLMLGYLRFRAEPAEGFRFARQALKLWYSEKNSYGIAQAHKAIAVFATVTGEFEAAQCDYKDALEKFQSIGDKDDEAVVLNEMGYVSHELGDVELSLAQYRRAKAILVSVQDELGLVEAIRGMGKALTAMGQYQQLLPLYTEKLRLAQKNGNPAQIASAWADIASVYELKRQYGKAESLYRRSLASYRSGHLDYGVGDILIRLAHLRAGQAGYLQAISFLEDALLLKNKTGQIGDIAKIQYELAYIYRRLNRLDDARTAIEKTLEIIESERLKIESFDSRAAYFASVHKYYALYIQVLMLLHGRNPERGFMQLAFEASEKSKVRAFLDLLTTSGQNSACDEVLREQLVADSAESHTSDLRQTASAPPVLTLKQIQTEIENDDTVVLEYALGDEKSYVWVLDQKQIVAHELPAADRTRTLVWKFRNTLTARQPRLDDSSLEEYKKRVRRSDMESPVLARQLSSLLLGPVGVAGAKRILIVPDGSLQYIPFSTLSLPAEDEKAILIGHHEVVILPSASALSSLRSAQAKRNAPTSVAAIFADPVFERDDPRVIQAGTSRRKKSEGGPPDLALALRDTHGSEYIDRLPGSRAEAEMIRQVFRNQNVLVAEGFSASKDYVLQGGLDRYRVIHFATHGIIDALHPEMSGIILSLVNERGQRQDGYLRLGDIYKLKLSADVVVLSACSTALGRNMESEGIIGLPRGFLYAGAKSVIASLWKVDDKATAQFMRGFYRRMQRGESPSSSLRGAQLEMSQGQQWSPPFYWAGFVLQGDYK
jgi:CHAT domain-containing protein/tetratricopeptide (TPR) repeat protein